MTLEQLKGILPRFSIKEYPGCIFYKELERYDGAFNAYRVDQGKMKSVIISRNCEVEPIPVVRENLRVGDKVENLVFRSVKQEAVLDAGTIVTIDAIEERSPYENTYLVHGKDGYPWYLREGEVRSVN